MYTSLHRSNKLNLIMNYHNFDDNEEYFSKQPIRKQSEDEKPSKGKKPRKLDRQKARDKKREYE
jgi:hypothetical protein